MSRKKGKGLSRRSRNHDRIKRSRAHSQVTRPEQNVQPQNGLLENDQRQSEGQVHMSQEPGPSNVVAQEEDFVLPSLDDDLPQ